MDKLTEQLDAAGYGIVGPPATPQTFPKRRGADICPCRDDAQPHIMSENGECVLCLGFAKWR